MTRRTYKVDLVRAMAAACLLESRDFINAEAQHELDWDGSKSYPDEPEYNVVRASGDDWLIIEGEQLILEGKPKAIFENHHYVVTSAFESWLGIGNPDTLEELFEMAIQWVRRQYPMLAAVSRIRWTYESELKVSGEPTDPAGA